MSIAAAIEASKLKYRKRKEDLRVRREKIRQEIDGDSGNKPEGNETEENKITEDETPKSKFRIIILSSLAAIVAFFETLPLFLAFVITTLVLVCVISLVVVIFTFISMIKNELQPLDTQITPDEVESTEQGTSGGTLSWTDAQLASNGMLLSDYEKNLYRLGILARKAVEGYGGAELMQVGDMDINTRVLFVMGVASTETSMKFYANGENHDIMKVPSNIPANTSGYGFMGIGKGKKLSDYFPDVYTNIVKEYKPISTPAYPATYAPYGVAMSAKHHNTDIKTYTNTKTTTAKIEKIAAEWGIVANKQEFVDMTKIFLAQAEYHGADDRHATEYSGYINFYAALFAATSDTDGDRSFTKWSYSIPSDTSKIDYSESGIRQSILGAWGDKSKNQLHKISTPSSMPMDKDRSTKILLNGKEIGVPVWKYVWEKYKDKQGMKLAWEVAQMYSARSGNISDRVLNFHYGFNSFMSGMRIQAVLAGKMNISTESSGSSASAGKFAVTAGKGQATVNGKPSIDFINTYKAKNPGQASYLNSLIKTWGTSSYVSNDKSQARKDGYKDTKYNVPFYGQSNKWGEVYNNLAWYPGSSTYGWSGCMVYSAAYAVSAMTGLLVNPSEMGAIMIADGSLVSVGVSTSKWPTTFNKMGLQSNYYDVAVNNYDKIAADIKKGGVAIVRVHPGTFTKSENHFIVLTSVTEKNGVRYYTIYSSSSTSDSMKSYSESQLRSNMHKQAVTVWK
jgi:hypothetical protein